MNIVDVVDLYTQLTALGIEVWFDGGWGVDALLGEQTRPHADVDIVVQHKDVPRLREFLARRGYTDVPRDDTSPWNFVLGDPQGRLVDVHAVTLDADGNGLYGPPEKGVMYPAGSLTGSGVINGHAVKCISAEHVVRFHTGYKLRPTDSQDVAALCARFGIDLPEEYAAEGRRKSFRAVIENAGDGGAFVTVPFDVEQVFGKKRPKIKATIDGEPYRGSLVRMGGPCHLLLVLKEIRAKIGKSFGDEVTVVVEEDSEPREVEIPPDLRQALADDPAAQSFFAQLSYTHQREYVLWIEEARQAQTRLKRIGRAVAMLKQGQKAR
jgi:lincosamide nucleotidyltransferase A/C/D/E